MAKLAAVLAALLCAATWAMSSEIEHAGACSGPAGYLQILNADVIFEGTVESVVPNGQPDLTFAPHELTFSVTRGHRGAAEGETLVANARIPIPAVPIMCPQFPQDLEGRYVLMGLRAGDDGVLQADAWVMLYMSDSPPAADDPAYAQAVKYAELAADSNPDRPVLRATPSAVACDGLMSFTGMRFPPGEYVIREAYGRILGIVTAGPGGDLILDRSAQFAQCLSEMAQTFDAWVEVYPITNADPFITETGALAELTLVKVTASGTGTAGGSVIEILDRTPFYCGATVSVVGTNFLAEPLTIVFEGAGHTTSTSAFPPPHVGTFGFSAPLQIPAQACDAPLAAISVYQAGFERFGRPLARLYVVPLNAPPGPPDLGNTQPAGPEVPWLHLTALAAIILGASLLTARR